MTARESDVSDPLAWLDDELTLREQQGLLRVRRTVQPLPNGRCEIDGRELLNFATNDYLGLAGHPRVIEAAQSAIVASGTGARASALLTGRSEWHNRLEQRIATFERTESALLFPSGYAANVGVIGALAGQGDVVCGDRLNHASLIDGCRLSGATFRVYPHGDADRLDHELKKHALVQRKLIVTDGLFSMDGDIAPLADLFDVASRHRAMLLVDEAHATGVLGDTGRGACEHVGLDNSQVIRIGTLSKALGAQGGFVAGSRGLIEYLLNHARSQIYSTALCPSACAAAIAAIDIVEKQPERRATLLENANSVRTQLADSGFPISSNSVGPILPVVIGEPSGTVCLSLELEEQGMLVPAIRPPSVPRGSSRLRISLTADHSVSDLRHLVNAIESIGISASAKKPPVKMSTLRPIESRHLKSFVKVFHLELPFGDLRAHTTCAES